MTSANGTKSWSNPAAAAWPLKVSDAAAQVLAGLSPAEQTNLASSSDDDLYIQHFGLGTQIRNEFGLWQGNTELLDDCTRMSHSSDAQPESDIDEAALFAGRMDVDGASDIILLAARDLALQNC